MKAPRFNYEKQQWDRYKAFHTEDECFSCFSDGSLAVNYRAQKPHNRCVWPKYDVEFFFPKDPRVSGAGGYKFFDPMGVPVTKKSITENRLGGVDQTLFMRDNDTRKVWVLNSTLQLPAWVMRGWPQNVLYWPGIGDPLAGLIRILGIRDPDQYPALRDLTAWCISAEQLIPREGFINSWVRDTLHKVMSVVIDCSPNLDAILDFLNYVEATKEKASDTKGTDSIATKMTEYYNKNYTSGGPQPFTNDHMLQLRDALRCVTNFYIDNGPNFVSGVVRCAAAEYDQNKRSSIFLTHRDRKVPFLYAET